MEAIRNINPFLTFKGFLISCAAIAVFAIIMFIGAQVRYVTIRDDVIGQAPRVECPIAVTLNEEERHVEYSASCPWGEMTGTLNAFTHFTSPSDVLSCYSADYLEQTFSGCSWPKSDEDDIEESWQTQLTCNKVCINT